MRVFVLLFAVACGAAQAADTITTPLPAGCQPQLVGNTVSCITGTTPPTCAPTPPTCPATVPAGCPPCTESLPPVTTIPKTIEGIRTLTIEVNYEVQATTDTGTNLVDRTLIVRMVKGNSITWFQSPSGSQTKSKYWVTTNPNGPPVWSDYGGGYVYATPGKYIVIAGKGIKYRDSTAVKVYP